ncbi:hypothetical protein PHLH8_43000 [Pseudomonas sp. Pc102]|nr:hypothetical protein PHLH8_43000 [Pseudomonas sp. Pc102]
MNPQSPYSPPQSSLAQQSGGVWVGKLLKVNNNAALPCVCISCATDTELEAVSTRINYVSPLTFLWLLLSPLALIAAYFISRKRLDISYSQCASCLKKKAFWTWVLRATLVVFVLALVLRISANTGQFNLPLSGLIFGSLLFALFAVTMKDMRKISVERVEGDAFYLKGFKDKVREKLVSA